MEPKEQQNKQQQRRRRRSNMVRPEPHDDDGGGDDDDDGIQPIVLTVRDASHTPNTNVKMNSVAGRGGHSLYILHLLARTTELFLDIMPGLLLAFLYAFVGVTLTGVITLANAGMGFNADVVRSAMQTLFSGAFIVHTVDFGYTTICTFGLFWHQSTYTDVYARLTHPTSVRHEMLVRLWRLLSIALSSCLVLVILICYNGNYCAAVANLGSAITVVVGWMTLCYLRMGGTIYNLFTHHFLADPNVMNNELVVTETLRLAAIAKGRPIGDITQIPRAKVRATLNALQEECERAVADEENADAAKAAADTADAAAKLEASRISRRARLPPIATAAVAAVSRPVLTPTSIPEPTPWTPPPTPQPRQPPPPPQPEPAPPKHELLDQLRLARRAARLAVPVDHYLD